MFLKLYPLSTPAIFEGPVLPPITSSYKRKYEEEEEEYDSEMDDFIDDEGEDQDEISKHIREIFGYDKSKWVLTQLKIYIKYPWAWKILYAGIWSRQLCVCVFA